MDKTILEIPTDLLEAAKLTADEAKTELAIRLYQLHKLNDEQAGVLAGNPKLIEEMAWNNRSTGRFDMDEFLSWASHDLKTPLNAIIGFTRVVMKGMDGPVNDIQTTDLTTVYNGGQRMLALVGNLVDMARLNNGEITLNREPCELRSILVNTADQWQVKNPNKNLTTDIIIHEPVYNIDLARVNQIVTSLLSLAATRVVEGSLSLSARDNDNGAVITVQSTGRKSRDKFEMDSAMLGFISSSLIKLHGGNTESVEETEDGMMIVFHLPR
ncbi:MAG TPA: histidine kinase dimerization/phospho-acceptor domain-containing protein [Anaerolineales bacterium]|nr:histidine kinase dimerization/phospho-acceptor domain-containing protein [Anaerolineales bacterium]HMZ43915.1 histidine kinase dimerization/phospho-acceptor domain-containing protein [Anaerolineales bacterium]HNC89901.1 histidine kinase dimerization/phospho-acceptor domain-containing protein [Anaerolineales bacterium]HNH05061.1 histidine kinase dimerization/phospho-acceptor domain-containing protein [Anaerolineales bacterium]HUM28118.1 histidine kinase dimerization/phospho-acceptor domain-co